MAQDTSHSDCRAQDAGGVERSPKSRITKRRDRIMTSTLILENATSDQLIDHFPEFMDLYTKKPLDFSLNKALEAFESTLRKPLSMFGLDPCKAESKRREVIDKIIQKYLSTQLAKRFPLIDQNILNLERHVQIRFERLLDSPTVVAESRISPEILPELEIPVKSSKKDEVVERWFKVPLVCRVSDSTETFTLAEVKHPKSRSSHNTHFLRVSFPGEFDRKCEEMAAEGFAILLESVAALYRTKYFPFLKEKGYRNGNWTKPTLEALWIPVTSAMRFERMPAPGQDPALCLRMLDDLFFIGCWDSGDQEEPIEDLLKEFF